MGFPSSPLAQTSTSGLNGATTGAVDTTGANLLVVSGGWFNGVTPDPTFTDSKGNTWTALTKQTDAGLSGRMWWCSPTSVGSGHTFDMAGSTLAISFYIQAWSGAAASPYDGENGASANATAVIQTGSLTPSQANDLIVSSFVPSVAGTYTVDSGFTISDTIQFNSGVNEGGAQAYLIQGAASAVNPQWASGGAGASITASIAAFKAAAGGGPAFLARQAYQVNQSLNRSASF